MVRPPLPTAGQFGWDDELLVVLTDLRDVQDAMPVSAIASTGEYWGPTYITGNYGLSWESLILTPLWMPRGGAAVDRIGITVKTAAGASETCRLGIYAANSSTFLPDALVVDAGTVAVDSTGVKEITISETIGDDNDMSLAYIAIGSSEYGGANLATAMNMPWSPLGYRTLSGYGYHSIIYEPFTIGDGLPDPFPIGSSYRWTSAPSAFVRFA